MQVKHYLGGGPVSAASKDFFIASMAASWGSKQVKMGAIENSDWSTHLVNLFNGLGTGLLSSGHPVRRAQL